MTNKTIREENKDTVQEKVQEILDFMKSDYPKANSQKEHEHNIQIVEYAVNQCKYGLKEKLRQSFHSTLLTQLQETEDMVVREMEQVEYPFGTDYPATKHLNNLYSALKEKKSNLEKEV